MALPSDPAADPRPRPVWYVEGLLVVAFYGLYSLIRDLHGANTANLHQAGHDADRIIGLERHLHVFAEARIQHLFIHSTGAIGLFDDYYGSAHFLVPAAVLVWLFFAQPARYRLWRNVLAICTGLALLGFAFFPVLPPRLLPLMQYHIVDTLKVVGGLWNISGGPASSLSNQYAAMPSLHTAWSLWCALAVATACPRRWEKVAVFAYPLLTILCVVVTGNHYLLDAAAGIVTVGLAYVLGRGLAGVPRRSRVPVPSPEELAEPVTAGA